MIILSPREKTVLTHLADGLQIAEIADRIGVSDAAVKTYILRASKKLGAKSQIHAVAIALRLRLI